jgi:D-amino-acid dehydrogenase
MMADELPVIGRSPRLKNVFLAFGHGMLGLSMSAATGRLIAELVAGLAPHVDPAPYSPQRIA